MTRRPRPVPSAMLGAALLAALPSALPAQQAETQEVVTASATVQTVDMETREVLLRDDATGEVFVVTAGPEVRNLAQLEPGDVVEASYVRAVAARMAAPGETGTVAAAVGGAAAEGEKPGAAAGESVSVIVEFVSYDGESHVATVVDEEGLTHRILVRAPEMRDFAAGLSEGDRVEVTFTEAVAVGVVER